MNYVCPFYGLLQLPIVRLCEGHPLGAYQFVEYGDILLFHDIGEICGGFCILRSVCIPEFHSPAVRICAYDTYAVPVSDQRFCKTPSGNRHSVVCGVKLIGDQ